MTALSWKAQGPADNIMTSLGMEALRLCPSPCTHLSVSRPFPLGPPPPNIEDAPLPQSVGLTHSHAGLEVGPDSDSLHDEMLARLF